MESSMEGTYMQFERKYMSCTETHMLLVQDANNELCQGSDTNEVNPTKK